MQVSKEEFMNCVGDFTYMWGQTFLIETPYGNYIWLDPEYNGDNSMTKFDGNYWKACSYLNIPFGRSKGQHVIKDYCGEDFIIKVSS